MNEHYESSSSDEEVNTSLGSLESEESLDDASSKGEVQREIVSFGDSMEERTSVRIVADQLSAIPKSVMFVSAPSPVQIIGQLQMLTQHMHFVCQHKSSLDLEISTEQAQRFAESYVRHSKLHGDQRFAEELANMLIEPDQGSDQGSVRPMDLSGASSP